MPGIPQETIDRVLDATDIVELIGSLIPLKPLGLSYVGLCPFHEDKSPSLSVTREKKIFRCFGCGTGGNVITFLRKHKNIQFPEAVRLLAERANIPVESSPDKNREAFLHCLGKAQEEFSNQLRSGNYRTPVNYLTQRGIKSEVQEEFGLGFAGSVKDLIGALKKAGITDKAIPIGAGILKEKDQGVICPFLGRVTFSLLDSKGATVGFGGRAIDSSAQTKYLNSSDSPIFARRKILFGLKQASITNDVVLLVEGYFDVVTLHQAGFKNTVGLLGTEITAEQMGILKTIAREVVLVFDGDAGGRAALLKALKVQQAQWAVKAAMLPEGYDPDQLVREGRVDEFENLLQHARPINEVAVEIVAACKEIKSSDRLAEEITRLGAEIPDPLEASHFVGAAAEALQLPAWALQEKTQSRRDKKEKLFERKKQLEKFVVQELLAQPGLVANSKIKSIENLFDDPEQKQILANQILKHA